MKNLNSIALSFLVTLATVPAAAMSSDLNTMSRARLYFQKGDLNKAAELYSQIPKSSDYYLESLEEKSQVMGRKGEYAAALSLLQTVTATPFDGLVGPEPYFVTALTDLKICDYASVFKVTTQFKERFKLRIAKLTTIDKDGTSPAVEEVLKRIKKNQVTFESLGPLAKELPRKLSRDKGVNSGSPLTAKARIRALAHEELAEIQDTINKLQIVEAEVIERIHLAEGNKNARASQGGKAAKEDLIFPVSKDGEEVWMDELGNFDAQIKKCPTTNVTRSTKRVSL